VKEDVMTSNSHIHSASSQPDAFRAEAAELQRDISWADRASTGDRTAFSEIYSTYQNRVYGMSMRLTGDVGAAEQLTQDTFVKAWFSIGTYKGSGHLGGWLGRVATNLWRDQFRSRVRREKLALDAFVAKGGSADAEPTASHSGAAQAGHEGVIPLLTAIDLDRCIARLPEGGRVIFVFHDVEGYTHREIAELLGVTEGTVKSQLHRARRLLRNMLKES
jgi:RNA polymerase sigma-70 factor (ECF subfamily)